MVREFLSFLIDAFSIEKFMKRDRKTVTELGNGTFNGEAGRLTASHSGAFNLQPLF